jgi:hypothetical protein
LAQQNGMPGIHFVGHTLLEEDTDSILQKGFDAVNMVRLYHFYQHQYSLPERAFMKMRRLWLKHGSIFDYEKLWPFFSDLADRQENIYPTIIPNWDHSPRSGRRGNIFINSNPQVLYFSNPGMSGQKGIIWSPILSLGGVMLRLCETLYVSISLR